MNSAPDISPESFPRSSGWLSNNPETAPLRYSTAPSQLTLAPMRDSGLEPAPSATTAIRQPADSAVSNQSSQLVPSCLCFFPRTRAPIASHLPTR